MALMVANIVEPDEISAALPSGSPLFAGIAYLGPPTHVPYKRYTVNRYKV